jgi:hypothetical protein
LEELGHAERHRYFDPDNPYAKIDLPSYAGRARATGEAVAIALGPDYAEYGQMLVGPVMRLQLAFASSTLAKAASVRNPLTIFGPALHDLTLEYLKRFLADAAKEPLLWEAKGTEINAASVRKQVGGFANSHDGGHLIIGASESGGSWVLDGVKFHADPPTWISSVVRDGGVIPYPDGLDTKAIATSDSSHR